MTLKADDILSAELLDATRPFVQDVMTPHGAYIFKFEEDASETLYNQKILTRFKMNAVDTQKADDDFRKDLADRKLFTDYEGYDLVIMPKVPGQTFRKLDRENPNNKKKVYKEFADKNLAGAVIFNYFDMNSENVMTPGIIIDTARGLFKNKHAIMPVDKLFVTLTNTRETFPHFFGYKDKGSLMEQIKGFEKILASDREELMRDFGDSYDMICQRTAAFKNFVKTDKSLNSVKKGA